MLGLSRSECENVLPLSIAIHNSDGPFSGLALGGMLTGWIRIALFDNPDIGITPRMMPPRLVEQRQDMHGIHSSRTPPHCVKRAIAELCIRNGCSPLILTAETMLKCAENEGGVDNLQGSSNKSKARIVVRDHLFEPKKSPQM